MAEGKGLEKPSAAFMKYVLMSSNPVAPKRMVQAHCTLILGGAIVPAAPFAGGKEPPCRLSAVRSAGSANRGGTRTAAAGWREDGPRHLLWTLRCDGGRRREAAYALFWACKVPPVYRLPFICACSFQTALSVPLVYVGTLCQTDPLASADFGVGSATGDAVNQPHTPPATSAYFRGSPHPSTRPAVPQ